MEEIYILSDGTSTDVSSLSEFEKTKFFLDNPKAVKQKDTAKGAVVVSKRDKAQKAQSMGSSSEKPSSVSKKTFRLPTDEEYEKYKKTLPNKPTYGANKTAPTSYNDFYDLKEQLAEKVDQPKQNLSYNEGKNKDFISNIQKNNPRYFPAKNLNKEELYQDINIQNALNNGYLTKDDFVKAGLEDSDTPVSALTQVSQKDTDQAMKRINRFRTKGANEIETALNVLDLKNPYAYRNADEGDDFAGTLFNNDELAKMNIDVSDFNGYLTTKGYKDNIKKFMKLGLDESSYGQSYDTKLNLERKKVQYLNMYINEQIQRDIKQQKLAHELKFGIDPDVANVKFKPSNGNINLSMYQDFLKKEAPTLTAKMMEVDQKNLNAYENLVKSKGNVGTGRVVSGLATNGWNGFAKAVSETSASFYGILPGDYFEGISESIREKMAVEDLLRGTEYKYVTADGYKTTVDGVQYIADGKGQVYDVTNKINVSTILPQQKIDSITEKARGEGVRDKSFSFAGTAYQGANVIGDLAWQLALTQATGTATKSVGAFTEGLGVLGKTKGFLRSVPIKRDMANAVIAQSTLGFSKGYESTLRTAREAGISDSDAKELAAIASIETGAWYAVTAPISPGTKATDVLFGKAKNEVIESALRAYTSGGKKAFLNTFKEYGKGFLNAGGEGLKELFQENVQQAGEVFMINKDINEEAGKKILDDTMSLQDFMDTSILSFLAGSVIPGAGVAATAVRKTARQMLGMQGVDRFNALNDLAMNRSKVDDLLSKQVVEGLYTQEQVDNILGEIDAYSSSINKMPHDISAEAAEDILEDVTELSKLEQSKKDVDKSFHGPIDEQINEVRSRIERRYYDDVTAKRTGFIKELIKKGKVENIQLREFDNSEDLKQTLISEFGIEEDKADFTSKQMGANIPIKDADGNQKKLIVINNDVSANSKVYIDYDENGNPIEKRTGRGYSVSQHEFLHGLIFETVRNDPEAQRLIGKALIGELSKLQDKANESSSDAVLISEKMFKRLKQYDQRLAKIKQELRLKHGSDLDSFNREYDANVGSNWEEALTLFSDAISEGHVKFDEDVFTKIGDMLRRVLQRLGVKNVEFRSGKDVYNFIKDYNRAVEKGDFGSAVFKAKGGKININKESLRKETKDTGTRYTQQSEEDIKKGKEFSTDAKFSLKGERIDPDKFKKEINSYYDKNKWGSQPDYIDSKIYDILNKYEVTIVQKAKGYGYAYLPDYSEMDMVAETQMALIPVVRNFNKEFFELRNEYKEKLKSRGLKEGTKEFNEELEAQDVKGYKGKKGVVKENTDLNAYINSLLKFKMMDALKTGSVTSQQYNEDIDSEFFKESKAEGFDYEESEDMLDEIDSLLDQKQEFEQEQSRLAVLLKDPVFGFTDEDGNPIDIETIPFGAMYVDDINDPIIPANKKLKKATDPEEVRLLNEQLKKLERGLELQSKSEPTPEEKEELKTLKSFKSYNLSTGAMVNTFEALSTLDRPSKIISDEIAREILRAPNLETLEYRNFKDKLSLTAQTMARRMTFKNSASLNKFMYDNWDLIYNVINNPVDAVSGESSYASKKLPPRLKELDENGNFRKVKNINRTTFLQSYFGEEETKNILNTYSKNPSVEINKLEEPEVNEKTGNKLWATAYFDRRTALMELFGDVLVLQEARRLLRQDSFLESIRERNVNLYNDLKDDTKREAVLNNMAKGKSDIVKYSLAFATSDEINAINRKDRVLTRGTLLTPNQIREKNISISTNPYTFLISPKSIEETVKYSLQDLTSSKLEGYNKKYENHYKEYSDGKGKFTSPEAKNKWFEQEKKDYVKALMLSDLKDQQPGTKLHTLKSYEEIRKEVEKRVDDIVYNLRNENYDSKFLYTGAELKRDGLSEDELENQRQDIQSIRLQQNAVLGDVFRVIGTKSYRDEESEPIKYYNNIFYTYLFLEDVISNRYSIDYKNKDVSRNKFKTNDFSKTRLPIDVPMEYLLKKSKDLFYESSSLYPLLVYNSYKLNEEETYKKQWQSKNVANLENGHMAFKFDQSTNKDDQFSLHLFASRNEKSRWCTGDILFYAEDQLAQGDFYIISDKHYTPVIAVRTVNNNGKVTIGEIVGTHKSTEFKDVDETQIIKTSSELPLLIEFYNKLSKSNELGQTNNKLPDLNLFLKNIDNILEEKTEQIKEEFKNEDFIRQFSIFKSRRVNLNNREEIIDKFKGIERELIDSGFIENISPDSIFKVEDFDDEDVVAVVDLAEDQTLNIDEDEGILVGEYINTLSEQTGLTQALQDIADIQGKEVILTVRNGEIKDYGLEIRNVENLGKTVFERFPYVILPDLTQADSIVMERVPIRSNIIPLLSSTEGLGIGALDISAEFESGESKDVIVSDLDMMTDYFAISFTGDEKDSNSNYSVDISKVFSDNGVSIYGEYIDTVFTPKIITELDIEYNDRLTIVNLENAGILRLRLNKNNTNTFNLDDVEFLGKNETKIKKLIIVPEFYEKVDYDIKQLVSNLQNSKNNSIFEQISITELGKPVASRIIVKDTNKNIQLGDIKFSLAEEENAKNSVYLSDQNIDEQVFISRTIDDAVTNSRNISEKPVKFKVPNLKGMNDKAISFMLIDKVAQGYNDFEFLNKKDAEGTLTGKVLNSSDIKYSLASENAQYNSNLEVAMNEIIEENTGTSVNIKYSPETAKNLGKNIGKYEIFVPAADDDFVGLIYRLATGKGKLGEKQMEFFNKTLIQPYSDAMLNLTHARQAMYADWTDLINKKYKNISKKLKKDSGYGNYTLDQAVRVYLWKQAGYEIPGLDSRDLINLTNIVRQDRELRDFATDVSHMSKQANGYVEPDHNWGYGSVVGDINNVISKSNRKKFLEHWQHNVDKILSKDNLSKIEALYGREYISALKNILDRMRLGTNRLDNSSDGFVNWLNGATGITMFLNMRSAVLQTLSAANFINTGDNNVIKATAAMTNQPQFWKDFFTLWNSDYLKDRRSGLMNDVAEAELAQVMNDPRNKNVLDKVKAFNYWVLKQGFAPTRLADSFAIAFGGATFYRNRIKTYLKEGYSEEEASKMTMRDFYETAEASQQSADTSKISKNQASLKGRLIFAFQNTPLQYSRLMKRAWIDIIKGRGSFANNIAKILYYGVVQNLMFNFMQNALFALLWDDEDEQKEAGLNTATMRTLNGSFDGILRGSGFKGAIISTIKNVIVKWYDVHGDPKAGGEVVVEALNISPPIGIKARKMMKAYKALEYNSDEIVDKGFSIDNTYALEAVTTITAAALNTPTDRLYQKAINVDDAIRGDFETMERVALLLGYSKWNLGKGESTNPKPKKSGLQDLELQEVELQELELEEVETEE